MLCMYIWQIKLVQQQVKKLGQILKVPFDTIENSNGDFLSFDTQNNGIKINKNISKIRVTTKVLFDASSYQIENPVVRSLGTKKYISVIISNSTESKKY